MNSSPHTQTSSMSNNVVGMQQQQSFPTPIMQGIPRPYVANQEFPLKIVVNARYVGAIIGHGGCNIRDISKFSKARCMVDTNNSTYDESGTRRS
uniref:K Homology domain-containing protein n=1 Tax=Ditylenchus dipsaci TaxID=166011 RepID=A0A915DFA5_9BILA